MVRRVSQLISIFSTSVEKYFFLIKKTGNGVNGWLGMLNLYVVFALSLNISQTINLRTRPIGYADLFHYIIIYSMLEFIVINN